MISSDHPILSEQYVSIFGRREQRLSMRSILFRIRPDSYVVPLPSFLRSLDTYRRMCAKKSKCGVRHFGARMKMSTGNWIQGFVLDIP